MTIGETRPPFSGPRDPGDAWAVGPDGTRMWGRFGSAGLLVVDPSRGVLMQHRALWSHFGGTWGIPGGARHEGEAAIDAALRESHEEAGVPADALEPLFTQVLDLGFWTYTTAVAWTTRAFEPAIADAESLALSWIPVEGVQDLPLHPRFAEAWPELKAMICRRPVLIVDAANVVGARPDGWWRDRPGAAARLLAELEQTVSAGLPAGLLGLDAHTAWPDVVVVLEGEATAAGPPDRAAGTPRLDVVQAAGSGDDEIVARVRALRADDGAAPVTVATSDRGLRGRVAELGARSIGAGALREVLDRGSLS
ncbi:NUDIX domain-containing protein [Arthrobacter mobilis]|uniref:NUDIX domain-containing protein n=1 Tax=Arthrobacter mobilis TaxID=2724944 RepID=A0A7X6K468_9MICC|nr:NUDIX domain-containing protein [Arthrobacter mobilis]NKX55042.1 NUDIX domain-containing protein [Arthrobacter mobilis]